MVDTINIFLSPNCEYFINDKQKSERENNKWM